MDICDDEKGWHSIEEAEAKLSSDNEVYFKLREAEIEARSTNQRYSHTEVMTELRDQLHGSIASD